MREEKSVSMSW